MRKQNKIRIIATFAALFLTGALSYAQSTDALGTFTPYSVFGVGDINKAGTAFNKAMGGIGIGIRDNRLINILNPASYSERDALSVMLDFGMDQKNLIISGQNSKTGYNVFNVHHLVMSFPLYNDKSAFAFGVTPYSSVGYKFEEIEKDPQIINEMGDIRYQRYGTGGINRGFLGVSQKLGKFSVGFEGIYYFGTIDRYSNATFTTNQSYRSINTGTDFVVSSITGKGGIQFKSDIAKDVDMTFGATWLFGTKLSGDLTKYAYATNVSGIKDTIYHNVNDNTSMEIPSELGIGFSVRKMDKWLIGFDYTRQDWSKVAFSTTPGVNFSPAVSNKFNIGFEYIPNRFDIRYYSKRITYRGGAYFEKSYMKVAGNQINSMGITVGATLPLVGNNGVGLSMDMGQRGSLKNNTIRERYVMFNISISLYDRWFYKYRYE
jgi:hypothetical protein